MALTRADIEKAVLLGALGARSDFDLDPEEKVRQMPGLKRRPAAVLCPIIERSGTLHVVLTHRADHLKHHAGQVSFPGGKVEADDPSPLATALREAEEEIGMSADLVEVVGPIDPYQTGTGFRVTPFVGFVSRAWVPVIDPGEVSSVFEAPLDFLMDPANRKRDTRVWQGRERSWYAMPWEGHYIWGATAGMLKGLSDRIEALRSEGAA